MTISHSDNANGAFSSMGRSSRIRELDSVHQSLEERIEKLLALSNEVGNLYSYAVNTHQTLENPTVLHGLGQIKNQLVESLDMLQKMKPHIAHHVQHDLETNQVVRSNISYEAILMSAPINFYYELSSYIPYPVEQLLNNVIEIEQAIAHIQRQLHQLLPIRAPGDGDFRY
ncbi:hypothetical protein EC973_003656 [Apophysomyces ossiformis]|uniref:Uncharacterized protein n=1 Tax=Apophysomyces ossiformis TaxID=679940 RepID=A0A8H7BH08_9FUNG|nr:hypothetical protein EC973_003656 [Apophysomyces ossiformis]